MEEILKYPITEDKFINLFVDSLYDSELKYGCNDLYNAGVDSENELGMAILKSMQVLKQVGLAPKHHFKHFFVTSVENGNTFNDWHMSRMGFLLVLMHVSGNSPLLNKLKIEMVKLVK